MAYATADDMIAAFGSPRLVQLTDRVDPPAGLIDQAVMATALAWADSIIDGFLRARYRLPLQATHPMLTGLAQDLAWYRLHRETTEDARRRYDAAMAALKQLSSGAIKLPDESGGEPAGAGGAVVIESQTRLFSRDRMRGF
ncbi:gp436 family protein [Reyranella sp.]|uniref:gp436 family protein n=1 Tax=Reyranella sp. TaxID=1929291 RepID=UPI002731E708|nr:DUF1320 domain-containing protein [Reyranella sp.]MDP2373165.1 DUF1320 domain-containing protein [Reyranella sp.]